MGSLLDEAAYNDRMLVLPDGNVLLSTLKQSTLGSSRQQKARRPLAWASDGKQDHHSINGSNTYTLTGTQFNGLSEGASYGDDAEMSSNYPIIKLTNSSGTVKYARTFNWTPAVATGSALGDHTIYNATQDWDRVSTR